MHSGFRIARILGIDIRLDLSLVLIFFLILMSLAAGVFPAWHPEWSPRMRWGVALAASILFFTSVLLHELSHALVGRAGGISVRKITLFVFGGIAHLEGEPKSWRSELMMAAVGPVTSLAIGGICLGLVALQGASLDLEAMGPQEILAALPPSMTMLFWLGQVNIVLAVFNLVPGFPLDGGRVLRAILWGISSDRRRATMYASRLGQAFAWLLIALGIAMVFGLSVPVFGRGGFQGLWLAFIGWFLNNAARISYRQVLINDALEGVSALRVARTRFETVPSDATAQELVDNYIMAGDQRSFPVMSGDSFQGMISLENVRSIPRSDWKHRKVEELMTPVRSLASISPDEEAEEALERLAKSSVQQLPVVEDGKLRGLLRQDDFLRWMALQDTEIPAEPLQR